MLHWDVTLEDLRIIADVTRLDEPVKVSLSDNLTGKNESLEMNIEQFSAMLYLGAGGDELALSDKCYEIVGDMFDKLPTELRPIP